MHLNVSKWIEILSKKMYRKLSRNKSKSVEMYGNCIENPKLWFLSSMLSKWKPDLSRVGELVIIFGNASHHWALLNQFQTFSKPKREKDEGQAWFQKRRDRFWVFDRGSWEHTWEKRKRTIAQIYFVNRFQKEHS